MMHGGLIASILDEVMGRALNNAGIPKEKPFVTAEMTTYFLCPIAVGAQMYLSLIHILDEAGSDISLVITGGLRVSSDFAKALAMGADAIAVATAPLMAAACQQYRICGSGNCPVGIATQDPALRRRLPVETAAQRIANYFNVTQDCLLYTSSNRRRPDFHRRILSIHRKRNIQGHGHYQRPE